MRYTNRCIFTLHAQASQDFSTTSVYNLWLVLTYAKSEMCIFIAPKLCISAKIYGWIASCNLRQCFKSNRTLHAVV